VIDPKSADELLQHLYVDDFSQPFLDTAIAFSDGGDSKLWKNKDGFLPNLFKLCRDAIITAYLLIHGFTQIPTSIKQNCAVIWIGKNLSNERLSIIHHQSNNGVEYEDF
jgi:hypothetical protein